MEGERTELSVTILGTDYTVIGDRGEAYLRELAAYVNEQLEQAVHGRAMPLQRLLVLAALNIADDLFREREQRRRFSAEVVRRTERLLDLLGAAE